jgi:hypothetical protein
MDAMSGPARRDPPELLDVNVQQLAGMATLVAVRRLPRLEPAQLAQTMRSSTAETVETASDKQKAISAAVIRSRRNVTITSTSSSGVRCGIDRGADDRSSSPPCPSSR